VLLFYHCFQVFTKFIFKYLPYFVNQISDNIYINHDSVEKTAYQKIWDVYRIEMITNESTAKDLLKLIASNSIYLIWKDDSTEIQADTTKAEYLTISVEPIEKTTNLLVKIDFRVKAFEFTHVEPTNDNYHVILYNTDLITGLSKYIDTEFQSTFGNYAKFNFSLYPILDIGEAENDSITPNFTPLPTRTTTKKAIQIQMYEQVTAKNQLKKYLSLCNSTFAIDKTQTPVTIGTITTTLSSANVTGAGFLSLCAGMQITINGNQYTINTIVSDTALTIFGTALETLTGAGTTYQYYRFASIPENAVSQIANNLYELKISANYLYETNYNL